MVLGTMMVGLAPALALDNSNTNAPKKISPKSFANGQQALRVGLDELKAGEIVSSVAALTYAAANGQVIARWKLGEMYANGDGVPRDDLKAYRYFNQLVEDYNEDEPDQRDLSVFSNAFVTVGVYRLKRRTEQRGAAQPTARARIVSIRGDDLRRPERTI